MSNTDRLPYVEAELNYLGPTAERPRYYAYEPERRRAAVEHALRAAHDADPRHAADPARAVDLDCQGFALVEQRSAVRDFWDDDEVRRVYYPEAERVHEAGHRRQPRLHLRPSAAPPRRRASRTARAAARASRRPGCMSTTPPAPGRSGCAT